MLEKNIDFESVKSMDSLYILKDAVKGVAEGIKSLSQFSATLGHLPSSSGLPGRVTVSFFSVKASQNKAHTTLTCYRISQS